MTEKLVSERELTILFLIVLSISANKTGRETMTPLRSSFLVGFALLCSPSIKDGLAEELGIVCLQSCEDPIVKSVKTFVLTLHVDLEISELLIAHIDQDLPQKVADFFSKSGTPALFISGQNSLDKIKNEWGLIPMPSSPNINTSYKRIKDDHEDEWIGLGWIEFASIDQKLKDEDICDPDGEWLSCLEEPSKDSFVLKIRPNVPSWPIFGFGIPKVGDSNLSFDEEKSYAVVARSLSDSKWSEVARSIFLAVPDDNIRARRRIRVELWKKGGKEPIASIDKLVPQREKEIIGPDGRKSRNVCGGTAACPMFELPDSEFKNLFPESKQ